MLGELKVSHSCCRLQDVEKAYANLWATTAAERAMIQADPTAAVHTLLPKDIAQWHAAAGYQVTH